ncbi:hypothetical protein AVEN_160446-1 [Araneus ventricosus]|uniref:Uncharacterized protein n=1 Tax=Araneus ventricosus TaxID=182803 RepID=A0A4Y2VPP9_ARAVE|nr:hypothetical protein AVEN_160446-1 [Araneus ventricosus]
MTLSYHFTKPSAENTQLWWKSVLSNKLSRINIAKLVSFLTENEKLIKQPPNSTSSSDSDTYFSPSPRPQTYGIRPSRGSVDIHQLTHSIVVKTPLLLYILRGIGKTKGDKKFNICTKCNMIEATPQHLLDCVALVYDDLLKRPDFVLEVRKANELIDLI